MFFCNEPKSPWWKVVLGRAPKSCRVIANTYDDYIDAHDVVSRLEVPLEFLDLDNIRVLVGAIELNREHFVLATQVLRANLEMDDVA
jgi:hypothetical protein